MITLTILTIITFALAVRSLFIVIGTYKDPLLATFETYGEDERVVSPPLMMLLWFGLFFYVMTYWFMSSEAAFGLGLGILIIMSICYNFFAPLMQRYKDMFRRYPRWCYDLIQKTDREERRKIAYMWLFLPPSTRMIYNANNRLFEQWVEQVLVTVASR